MEVLLFILQKGGVGKTTSAAALASVLTQVHHKRVLLVLSLIHISEPTRP